MAKQKLVSKRGANKGICEYCKDPIELFEDICYAWNDPFLNNPLHDACKIQVQMNLKENES